MTVAEPIVWHGTSDEAKDLERAITNNGCTCTYGEEGRRLKTCSNHEMLLNQSTLDHLLFVRRLSGRFIAAEQCEPRESDPCE